MVTRFGYHSGLSSMSAAMPPFVVRILPLVAAAALAAPAALAQTGTPVEATNAAGDKILLYPDGRWEYADPAKRAATPRPGPSPAPAAPAVGTATGAGAQGASGSAAAAGPGSAKQTTPAPAAATASTQGGWLFGRKVPEGDPDYNRGSLNPKTR